MQATPAARRRPSTRSRKRWLVAALVVLALGIGGTAIMLLDNRGEPTHRTAEAKVGLSDNKTGMVKSPESKSSSKMAKGVASPTTTGASTPATQSQRGDPGLAMQHAVARYREEADRSRKDMEQNMTAARTKLLASLDQAHAKATQANQAEAAREIQEARAALTNPIWGEATEAQLMEPGRAEFGKQLLARQWYWHWEKRNQEQPFRYRPDGSIEFKEFKNRPGSCSFEQRQVLKFQNNYLLLTDDNTLHGFFIPTGRQVGSFADNKGKPNLVDPAEMMRSDEAKAAILQYREASQQARKEMTDQLAAALKSLVASLAAAETAAATMNQPNAAISIRESRTSLLNPIWGEATEEKLAGPSRTELARILMSRTWYLHWENRDRERPYRFLPDGSTQGKGAGGSWAIETRIVLKHTDHYLILTDNNTLQGFNIPTGRQVGAFADGKP